MKKYCVFLVVLLVICGCFSSNVSSIMTTESTETSCIFSNDETCSSSSCSTSNFILLKEELAEKYPLYVEPNNIGYYSPNRLYRNIIYLWQLENGEWRCGFKLDLDGNVIHIEKYQLMQGEYSCTLETFALLLSFFYDTTDPYFWLLEISYPTSVDDINCRRRISTNKMLYDALSLKASYVYNVLREEI